MPQTKEEKDSEKAEKDYEEKKDKLASFKLKHSVRIDSLCDIASDIAKRGINHANGLKGEIEDKLVVLRDIEEKRKNNPFVVEKNKYKTIIEELEKELELL